MAMHGQVGEYAETGEAGFFWTVLCDGCGRDMCDGGEYDAWDDPDYARDMAEVHGNDHVDLCDDCWFVLVRAYSEVELLALSAPQADPQGYLSAMAALGFLRRAAAPEEEQSTHAQ